MAYVVTGNCEGCVFTDCVEVCPVDCFYNARETDQMLYIDPEECIDCDACVPECPVEAIFAEDDVPEDQQKWIEINREKIAADGLEAITERQEPMPGALEKKERLGL